MAKTLNFKHISIHDTPEQSIGFLLWHVSTRWRSSLEAILRPFKLTHPQFVVLAATAWLTKNGAKASQIDIARMVGLDPNTTSQVLRGLEHKKLIDRTHAIDEKRKNPILTPMGRELLTNALPAVEKADAIFFSKLTMKENNELLNVFQKLRK